MSEHVCSDELPLPEGSLKSWEQALEFKKREDELKLSKLEQEIRTLRQQELTLKHQASYFVGERKVSEVQVTDLQRAWESEDYTSEKFRTYSFIGGVDERSVRKAMETLDEWANRSSEPITVRLYSPGGDVVAGLALYDFIVSLQNRETPIDVNTVALGWAASMAGVLLQVGTKRYAGPNAHVLIHEVSSISLGTVTERKDQLALDQRMQERLVNILTARSLLTREGIIEKWTRMDWWLDAGQLLELGLIDEVKAL